MSTETARLVHRTIPKSWIGAFAFLLLLGAVLIPLSVVLANSNDVSTDAIPAPATELVFKVFADLDIEPDAGSMFEYSLTGTSTIRYGTIGDGGVPLEMTALSLTGSGSLGNLNVTLPPSGVLDGLHDPSQGTMFEIVHFFVDRDSGE
jgi:hypothetical protein